MSEIVSIVKEIKIDEIDGICYVSSWSRFMMANMPENLDGKIVCDFGAGTGYLSIVAAIRGAESVTAIERNPDFRDLLKRNFDQNFVSHKIITVNSSSELSGSQTFDFIFCNPACYPTAVGDSSFYHAGDLGLEMMNEVFLFASKNLKKGGRLFLLIPSISPISLVNKYIDDLGLHRRFKDSIFVPFREHLCMKIRKWVNDNSKIYPEMKYFEENGAYCERVDLYDIFHPYSNTIGSVANRKKILLLSVGGTAVQSKDKEGITIISNDVEHYKMLQNLRVSLLKSFENTHILGNVNFEIEVLALLNKDSSNIVPSDWNMIIDSIVDNYDNFDSFIVLHGTNTMGYTCAAVSFALSNLGKLVVFTGAQVSYGSLGSDALKNIENAVLFSVKHSHQLHGVVAVFGNFIISGLRVSKTTSSDYDAFKAFEKNDTDIIGKTIGMKLNLTAVRKLNSWYTPPAFSANKLDVKKNFKLQKIVSLNEFPGMTSELFIDLVENYGARGFILRASGAGDPNVSEDDSLSLKAAFKFLRDREIPIVVTTQVYEGIASMEDNKPGTVARSLGAIPSHDMGIEAITIKLAWLLGQDFSYSEIQVLMATSLRGEIVADVNG